MNDGWRDRDGGSEVRITREDEKMMEEKEQSTFDTQMIRDLDECLRES